MSEATGTTGRRGWRRRRWMSPVYRWLRATLALVGLVMLIYHGCFDLSQIVSDSMKPTLRGDGSMNGDWVLAERVSYWFRSPRRWEVIALVNHDGMLVMKRVVGLPGERVSLVDGKFRINGQEVARPERLAGIRYLALGKLHNGGEVTCGDGYFVVGDDSRDSYDSRYEGPFESWRVRGRAWMIVGPAGRRGWVR